MSVVLIGASGSGKSTLAGQLCLTKDKSVADSCYCPVHVPESVEQSYPLSFISDTREIEREERQSFNVSHLLAANVSNEFSFTVIDAPGRIPSTKVAIASIIQGDVAILLLSAVGNDFKRDLEPHTGIAWQHLIYASVFGIQRVIVCVNKMDDPSVAFSQAKYSTIIQKAEKTLASCGFKSHQRSFVPIGALRGFNLFDSCSELSWSPTTLSHVMEKIEIDRKARSRPFRMTIAQVHRISGVGTVICGSVLSGSLQHGIEVTIEPHYRNHAPLRSKVFSMERHHVSLDVAQPGDFVGVHVHNMSRWDAQAGKLLCHRCEPCPLVTKFTALISILWHPTSIKEGYAPMFHFGSTRIPCQLTNIVDRIDRKTKKEIKKRKVGLVAGDLARVIITSKKSIAVEKHVSCKTLGSFVMLDHNRIVAIGKIEQLHANVNPVVNEYEEKEVQCTLQGTGRLTKPVHH